MIRPTKSLARYEVAVLSRPSANSVRVVYTPQRFEFPPCTLPHLDAARAHWEARSPQLTDGDAIISVRSASVSGGRLVLAYQPTTFFKFLWLNLSLDVALENRQTLRQLLETGALGQFREAALTSLLTEYRFPQLGNSLGITGVLVSKDLRLIAARRSDTSRAITTDKGKWQNAVGSQVKRHQPRFADEDGVPRPWRNAWEALLDEQGEHVYRSIASRPACRGLLYRLDLHYPEIVYEFRSTLTAADILELWKEKKGAPSDASEIGLTKDGDYDVKDIDVSTLGPLLEALRWESWSPQHAIGALLALRSHGFGREVREAGLVVPR